MLNSLHNSRTVSVRDKVRRKYNCDCFSCRIRTQSEFFTLMLSNFGVDDLDRIYGVGNGPQALQALSEIPDFGMLYLCDADMPADDPDEGEYETPPYDQERDDWADGDDIEFIV